MKYYEQIEVTNSAGKLAKLFLYNPLSLVLFIFLLGLGVIALSITPREENPQMVISGGAVIVALPGATSQEVEQVIIKPLERRFKEIKGVENIYGIAQDNVGIVEVQFYIGEDKEESNLKIYDKIMQNMDILPKGASSPLIKPLDIDTDIPIMSIAFYKHSDVTNGPELIELTNVVKEIQNEFNAVENVAVTNTIGGKKRQFNILIDIDKLAGYHLSIGHIQQAVESISTNFPNISTNTKQSRLVVFGIQNVIESVKDLENIIVAHHEGSFVYLKDVATVEDSYSIQNFKHAYISAIDDVNPQLGELVPQVTLTISKLKGTNAVTIADEISERLKEKNEALHQQNIHYIITRNDGERANHAVKELVFHLIISIVIIAVILAYVLGFKESLIVTLTVPAILAITLFVDYLTGQTINRITLFALLLSLGLLVDAAIIVIENIHRHLHEDKDQKKHMDVILIQATDEIGSATNIATLAIILTMIPMAFVGQMMGEFMKPIPYNVPVALLASLLVAYIFTPYLAKRLIKRTSHHEENV